MTSQESPAGDIGDASTVPAPAATLAAPVRGFGNLPRPGTTLIGRDADIQALIATLRTVRQLTLTGPGGVGKTRLAIALAEQQTATQPVHWVDLTTAPGDGSPDPVAAAVRAAAGIQDVSAAHGLARLRAVLSDPPALLVLDNADHVARPCAEVVDSLMRLCPALQILVTCRAPLGLEGETTFEVAPLPLPATGCDAGGESAACALFLDRVREVEHHFAITAGNRDDVVAVSRHLGGLPLAIELAAALTAHVGVERVLGAVARSVAERAPDAGRGEAVPSLGWCYDLLPEDAAMLFRRLAVFPTGFGLAGVAAVAGDASTRRPLSLLIGRRMVAAADRDGEPWYWLPPPLRALAIAKLLASADHQPAVTAHLGYVTALAGSLLTAPAAPPGPADLDRLQSRLPDIRAGLAAAQAAHATLVGEPGTPADRDGTPDPLHPVSGSGSWVGGPAESPDTVEAAARVALGVRLAGSVVRLCYLRGHYLQGQQWLEWAVVAARGGPPEPLADALRGAGRLAFLRCDYHLARARLQEALDLSTRSGDEPAVIENLMWLGSVARETSDYATAEDLCRRARELAVASGDEESVLRADIYLAFASWLQRRFDDTVARCSSTLVTATRLEDAEAVIWSLMSRGAATLYRGDLDPAEDALLDALERSRREQFTEGLAWSQHLLGVVRMRRGDRLGALALLREALGIHQGLGDRWRVTSVLDDLAALAAAAADGITAARFLGAAQALRRRIDVAPAPVEEPGRRTTYRIARGLLRGKDFDAELAAGETADVEELVRALGPAPRSTPAAEPPAATAVQPAPAATDQGAPTVSRAPTVQTMHRGPGEPEVPPAAIPTGAGVHAAGGLLVGVLDSGTIGSAATAGSAAPLAPAPAAPTRPGMGARPGGMRGPSGRSGGSGPAEREEHPRGRLHGLERLPSLDIRMLGASTVRVDGRLLRGTDFGYAKPRELLFLLAATGPGSKEEIGEALWPGSAEGKVRGALHTALRDLRRAVGSASLIIFNHGRYQLNPGADVTIDVTDFETGLDAARSLHSPREALPGLRHAVGLYRGEFLGDGPRPAWAAPIAERLRQCYRDLLMLIGRSLTKEGRWASATEIFLHAVHHDPGDQEAQRLLIAAWAGAATDATVDADGDWLVDFAQHSPSIRVTDPPGSTLLYQELVRRRRSARIGPTAGGRREPAR